MEIRIVGDLMVDLEGSIRPAIYLAIELVRRGYEVSVASPLMSRYVEEQLRARGITPINLRGKLIAEDLGSSFLWSEAWAREAFLRLNSRRLGSRFSATINFSHMVIVPSCVWYLQGSPSVALRDIEKELPPGLKIVYGIVSPIIEYADRTFVGHMASLSKSVIANSNFCASMYSKLGVDVQEVVYPPLDRETFHPSTSSPSSDYVVTYFGKETQFTTIKRIADMGVRIKAFGSKTSIIQRDLTSHPNIQFLGRVSTTELVQLYSNALFTLFPFTHEPFGYVPLESMGCGTPALTYDVQGPSEYVIDGSTGWLMHRDDELVRRAVELWEERYPSHMRLCCVDATSKFDKKFYIEKWIRILSGLVEKEG
jgi:glycosyltransferase involved in cell wall biosynthesis